MIGGVFLVCGLVGFGIGMMDWTRYQRATSPDPVLLGTSVLGFLSSAMCLVAAVVSFLA